MKISHPLRAVALLAATMLCLSCNRSEPAPTDTGATPTPEAPATTAPDTPKAPAAPATNAPTTGGISEDDMDDVITELQTYVGLLTLKNYDELYEVHLHSEGKAKTDKERFIKRFDEGGLGQTMRVLCAQILAAYNAGGLESGSIAASYDGKLPGSISIKLTGRKPRPNPKVGEAYRVVLARDPRILKFYDVD